MKYAVIDIGSNSVRLLLWADGHTLCKKIDTTRLGEGLSLTGLLTSAAMDRTAKAIGRFIAQAKEADADKIFAFATAAVRASKNGGEFVRLVRERLGIEIDVISGTEEAKIGLLGALDGQDGGIIDVGGASSEVTVSKGGKIVYAVSAEVGAVRLKDMCGEDREKLEKFISEKLAVYGEIPRSAMTAIGGTATSLAALEYEVEPYDPLCIHGKLLPTERILFWADKLLGMPQEERLKLRGMDKKRADILGGAALLLYSIAQRAGADHLRISEQDNLEGYLMQKMRRQS